MRTLIPYEGRRRVLEDSINFFWLKKDNGHQTWRRNVEQFTSATSLFDCHLSLKIICLQLLPSRSSNFLVIDTLSVRERIAARYLQPDLHGHVAISLSVSI